VTPRLRRLTVVGIFNAGMYEYDRNFAFLHLQDAARLYRLGNSVSGLRMQLHDVFAAPRVARQIDLELGGNYLVSDWTRQQVNFFRNIALTKRLLFFILLLVMTVAAFNVVSTLVMAVKDKRADIAILRTLGASPRGILKIFVAQGTGIGVIGTLAGVVLGVLLAINLQSILHGLEKVLGVRFLDAKLYLMSDLPAFVQGADVVKIAITALALCVLSTLYPAWRAARTQPAQALRND
jgi:lipoprotein-releasing system permease protein